MKAIRNILSIAITAILFTSCSTGKTIKMRVNHYQATGWGHHMTLMYYVQMGDKIGTDKWEYHYDRIRNFNYEPGYIYDLEVTEEEAKDAGPYDSKTELVVKKIVSKTKAPKDVTFEILLMENMDNTWLNKDEFGQLQLFYGANIDCGKFCKELEKGPESTKRLWGTFKHGDNGTLKLIKLENL